MVYGDFSLPPSATRWTRSVDLQYVRRADVGQWIAKEDYMRGRHAVRRSIARASSGTGSSSNLNKLRFKSRLVSSSTENLNVSANSSSSENHNTVTTPSAANAESEARSCFTPEV
ncbi:hypothetical protein Y032_0611g632 [Ancylostoma ceylanicum]|uniref:Uncharacterized protein n=1 Tax=Ancylostoma ceylanicum TaxID=53326 RepID=A0A016WLI6_9BILA|nr:hypothetical protein Y032_0611g632 [Ancylostoma ceylanicum]